MIAHSPTDKTIANSQAHQRPVQVLLRLTETVGFLRSTDGRFYADVSVDGRRETYKLKSAAFRDWLIDGYFRICHEIPSYRSMHHVCAWLAATARFEADTPSIFVRVGHDGNGFSKGKGSAGYLDLADPGGLAVKIGSDGWSVVSNPNVHFRRPEGQLPLPIPSRDGSIELLRPYVNLTDRDFRLLIVWMAAAIRPVGPYPVLGLYGPQGSGKSTLTRIVRMLIDPQANPRLAEPRNTRELMVSAVNGWLLAYDNVSAIPQWLADGLCRLATGEALAGASPAKGERTMFHPQRPVILNGIEEFVAPSDLIDRAVFLDLPPIAPDRRRCAEEFWDAFHRDYPRILGGLLDAVVGGLRELPSVRRNKLHRIADFGKFAEAVGRSLEWPAKTALLNYNDRRHEATIARLQDSPLGTFLLGDAYRVPEWTGAPARLLTEITRLAGKRVAASPRWPKSPGWFTHELRRFAPQLRDHGITVNFSRSYSGRLVSISRGARSVKRGALIPDGFLRDTP